MGSVRVLVVDDEPIVLRLMKQVFSRWGAEVDVGDGPAALRLLAERDFALVLSDTQMPGVGGIEVLEAAKRFCPGSVRVLMSGDPGALACGEGDDSPAHALLGKPIDRERLKALYGKATEEQSRADRLVESMRLRYADSPDAVFLKDTRGRYLIMNATGASLLQRPLAEIVGKLDSAVFDTGTLLEEVRASDKEVLRTRRPYCYVNATRNTGIASTFLSVKFPVMSSGGEIVAIGCLSRDVTALIGSAPVERDRRLAELERDLREVASILGADAGGLAVERAGFEAVLRQHEESGTSSSDTTARSR
jgi:CheY-like chemotaxis protein